jgi:hypothetical protein
MTPQFCNANTTLIADAAYDSNPLRDKLKELKIGKLLTGYNKRNTKNPDIIKSKKT